MKPLDDETIIKLLRQEELAMWVCSWGGCGGSTIPRWLDLTYEINVETPTWLSHGAHRIKPAKGSGIPLVYVVGDPVPSAANLWSAGKLKSSLVQMANYIDEDVPDFDEKTLDGLDLSMWARQRDFWIKEADILVCHDQYDSDLKRLLQYFELPFQGFTVRKHTVALEDMNAKVLDNIEKAVQVLN